ncbi:hypothetical protein BC833DRAFT_527622 [Globomyces pollinis-pini]|nr:hypothetical protein BC833DRAFT_527622 [Globomyces pollinis-pini]
MTYELGEATETDGRPRRMFSNKGQPLVTIPHPTVKTLYDILLYGCRVFPASQHLFGDRELRNIVEETKDVTKTVNGVETTEKKTWKYFDLGPYRWITYRDAKEITTAIGAGLVKLGLKKNDKLTIFASTSKEWMLMTYGCYSQGKVITTAYDNLGVDALIFSVNESEATAMFTQSDLFNVVKEIGTKCPTLKHIIYKGSPSETVLADVKKVVPHFNFVSFDELQKVGKDHPVAPNPPSPDDLCCIMYTSGSTGNPKGVMLSHKNLIASLAGAKVIVDGLVEAGDVYLAYLPLAHVLEFLLENILVFIGIPLGYGSTRSLTDASCRNCKGDLRELRPSVMAGVPAVWETIRKGVLSKLSEANPTQQKVFHLAYQLKKHLINLGLPHSFMDKIVFKKISDNTGGRLRVALSGGAPMAPETQEFLTVTLCHIVQGYGMTESCGFIAVQGLSDKGILGVVGTPSPACEVKLVATNNYNPNPTNGKKPQGEVWVRGDNMMSGYYKQEKVTAESFGPDNWFMTGDIGEWNEDGTLSIIDRKKNLVKLSHGEYVALEKLESQYKTSKLILNMVVHADSLQSYIVALITVNPKEMENLMNTLGIQTTDYSHPKLVEAFGKNLLQCAKNGGLKSAEVLKVFTLVHDEWTAENGFLTAAQKIKRKEILAHYKSDVDRMYGKK